MPKSDNPYDLINALEERCDELTMNACTDITAAEVVDDEIVSVDPEVQELIDLIIEYHIADKDEIDLITHVFGDDEDTLNKIINYRTGYDDIDTYLSEVYPED